MLAPLFSAGSNGVLQAIQGYTCDDPVSQRLVFQWIAPLPEPVNSFQFMYGKDTVFSNDFVAGQDVHDFRPKPVSVLLDPNLATPQLLAFSTRKGKNKQSRAQRKRKARAASKASNGSATNTRSIPGARAGLAWDESVLRQKGERVIITCEAPCGSNTQEAAPAQEPQQNTMWSDLEVPDRWVLRSRLDDIQRMCAQWFTLDGTCNASGSNRHFSRCCADKNDSDPQALGSFLSLESLSNEHVWLNLTSEMVDSYITQYMRLKAKDPCTVSGCFLVPYQSDCDWMKHFSHMQLLKEYPADTSMFFVTDANGKRQYLPRTPGPMRVYYDPQDPTIAAADAEPRFLLDGRIFTAKGRLFVDGGANTQYIGLSTCKRMGAVITSIPRQPKQVQVGDGRLANIVGACRVPVSVGAYRGFVTALVLDQFSDEFDLVLGESWLRAYKAQLNYGAYSALKLRVANRVVTIKVGQRGRKTAKLNALTTPAYRNAVASGDTPEELITTATQLKRSLKQSNGKYFYINVRHTPYAPQFRAITAEHSADGSTTIRVTPDQIPFDHPLDTAGVYTSEPSSVRILGGELVVDKTELQSLLKEFDDVFPGELPPGMPPDRNIVHPIPLSDDAKPSYRPMYRLSPEEKAECESQVKDLLEHGLIQPSSSPWGAPVLFVPKPNGKLRMCCDFRLLNKQTIKNKYPLPRIDDLLDVLHGKKVFSSLDLQSGYWQIALSPEDMQKTAFNTHFGHFEYKVMCFGLSNAPATFQSLMNDIFKEEIGKFVVIYLDDILIFSDTPQEHLDHLRRVLERLRQHQLYAQMPKCEFGLSELKFLGHIIGEFGVKPDPAKVEVVAQWPEPSNAAELRSFLGLAQYFRKFMQGYAQTVCCLYDLLKKNAAFNFTEKHRQAFEQVKYSLANAPVLKAPDFSRPFEIWTDASTHGIGAVLMQEDRPVAFESRKLSSAEYNYTTTDQELLAVVHALKVFRPYIEGKDTQIFTDHQALSWLLTKQDVSRREARWLEEISRYHLTLTYIPGRTNVADPVSRVPALRSINVAWFNALTRTRAGVIPAKSYAPPPVLAKHYKRRRVKVSKACTDDGVATPAQPSLEVESEPTRVTILPHDTDANPLPKRAEDPRATVAELLPRLKEWYDADPWFKQPQNLSRYGVILDEQHGLYYRENAKGRQLVIPNHKGLRQAILYEHHHPPWAGHRGYKPTEHLVQRLYWWPAMQADVHQYVTICPKCQANKASSKKPSGIAKSLPTPDRPWRCVSLDWMTDFRVTKHGFDSVLVVVDYLTKLAHFIPTHKDASAAEVARMLRRDIFRLHGLPKVLVSDRDSRLVGNYMQDLFKCLGVNHTPSTAYRPQTDGQTERLNRVIQEMLRNYVAPSHDDWDEYLDIAEFAYNNAYHESIKTTPFRLSCGFDPRTPSEMVLDATLNNPVVVAGKMMCYRYARKVLVASMTRSTVERPLNVPKGTGLNRFYPVNRFMNIALCDDVVADTWGEDGSNSESDSEETHHVPRRVSECPAARKFTSYMQQNLRHAKQCLDDAKQRQRAYAQTRMSEETYAENDYVWLSTVNIRRRMVGTRKLMPKFVGPFKITQVISNSAYRLDIGDTKKRMHDVFHSSLLKLNKGPVPDKIMPIVLEDDQSDPDYTSGKYERYEVEQIIKHRVMHRKRGSKGASATTKVDDIQYLIKWKGFDMLSNTWEPSKNVDKAPTLLRQYWQKWARDNPGKSPLVKVDKPAVD
jgi:transposase InsO family protein